MGRGGKIIAGSFWLIMGIHLAVFTAIGFATSSWRLLAIFIVGFVLFMAAWMAIKLYFGKNPEKRDAMLKLPMIRNINKDKDK